MSDDVDCARWADFLSATGWRGTEEDAKCVARRPVRNVPELDDRLAVLLGTVDRNRKVDLVSPGAGAGFDRKCLPDCVGRWSIIQAGDGSDVSCSNTEFSFHAFNFLPCKTVYSSIA